MAAGLAGLRAPKAKHYPDPILRDPALHRKPARTRRRKHDQRPMIKRGHIGPPTNCEPGTITYHDMLVRKFGRREADKYSRCRQAGQLDLLPDAAMLALHGDWDWLR